MMSVAENIAYGLKRRSVAKAEIGRKVEAMLARVGLPDSGDKRIDQLSGGQKQRIAIARCLVLDPDVLLLDEPLGALDLKLRESMKVELKQLQAAVGTTFVYITHDQSEALVMSEHVAVMNDGRFDQVGTPQELYYAPTTPFVAGFVGDSNRWSGEVEAVSGREARVLTTDGLAIIGSVQGDGARVGDTVDIFVRPESVVLDRDSGVLDGLANRLDGRVRSLLFNGANSSVMVGGRGGGGLINVALPQTGQFADLAVDEEIHLGWRAEQSLCFARTEET
jgi:spermidine/putrescine transport system ATP-binding protein